jgi:uncharacterized membrane protein YhaH (DUF805 family)
VHDPRAPIGFGTAVVTCLRKSVRARGRASRAEFWYFVLFCLGVFLVAGLAGAVIGGEAWASGFFAGAYVLLLVPWVAAGMRRLHDTGRGGGWCFLLFSMIGMIVVLVLWTEPGQPQPNRFGLTPRPG